MNLKIVRIIKENKIKIFNFKGHQIGEFEDSFEYDFLFPNNSKVSYVNGVFDRHRKFKIKKVNLKKEW